MAGRVNQIDKAIASLESERAILDMAIAKLRAQQQREKPAAKRNEKGGAVRAAGGQRGIKETARADETRA